MRTSADMPRRPRRSVNRRRVLFVGGAAAIVLIFGLSSSIAGFYTDYLWYDDLGVSTGVHHGPRCEVGPGGDLLRRRLPPRLRQPPDRRRASRPPGPRSGPDDEVVERFRDAVGVHMGKVRIAVAALLALLLGTGVKGRWEDYLLWRNHVAFGTVDPQFKKDVGFYVFDLPFRTFVVSWVIAALIATAIFTTAAHYLNGGIRLQSAQHRGATPAVKAHLSVLARGRRPRQGLRLLARALRAGVLEPGLRPRRLLHRRPRQAASARPAHAHLRVRAACCCWSTSSAAASPSPRSRSGCGCSSRSSSAASTPRSSSSSR